MQRPDRRQVRKIRHAKPLTGIVAELPVEGQHPHSCQRHYRLALFSSIRQRLSRETRGHERACNVRNGSESVASLAPRYVSFVPTPFASRKKDSLLRYVQFAVRLAKFPVLNVREIRRNDLNVFANARAASPKPASSAQNSLYFPPQQGNAKQRQVRR